MGDRLHFINLRHKQAFMSGRARHHDKLKRRASSRRSKVLAAVTSGQFERVDDIADHLHVHRATVYRDLQALAKDGRCETCGQVLPHKAE